LRPLERALRERVVVDLRFRDRLHAAADRQTAPADAAYARWAGDSTEGIVRSLTKFLSCIGRSLDVASARSCASASRDGRVDSACRKTLRRPAASWPGRLKPMR